MKKILYLGALLNVLLINAQDDTTDRLVIEKGTWNLGGNFSFGFSQNEFNFQNRDESGISENESTRISFFPNIGYALGKNFMVGLGLGYGYFKSENLSIRDEMVNSFNTSNSTSYSIFPYARGYFPVGRKLAFYAQGEVRFTDINTRFNDENSNLPANESDRKNYFIGVRPGLTFFVSKNFALETALGSFGYSREELERDDQGQGDSDSFNFNLNSSDLFFGLSYYF